MDIWLRDGLGSGWLSVEKEKGQAGPPSVNRHEGLTDEQDKSVWLTSKTENPRYPDELIQPLYERMKQR